MQLKYNRQPSVGSTIFKILLKTALAVLILVVAIFLVEKVKFPTPNNKFNIDITNDIKKL